jgi:hypothetical protein
LIRKSLSGDISGVEVVEKGEESSGSDDGHVFVCLFFVK